MVENKIRYMSRALELARLGLGNVSPNPMVGCVIVNDGRIIGEGFHQQYGSHHAEVNAINDVKDTSVLSDSEAYVTLEPCSFYGNTPPCADLLVKHKIKKVYISTIDTNPRVSGKGVEILEGAGIPVEQGVLEAEGLDLNKRFFTSNAKKRPYIILKWAETADGFVARSNFDSKWISNEFSRKLVHKWRAEEDAVLVGKNTANYDDPMLNVRDWAGKDPIRIVIDHELKLDRNLKLFDHQIPTICYNLLEDNEEEKLTFKKLEREKFMEQLVADLHTRKIQSLIVEGGTSTLQSFIEKGLWDEARVFTAPTCFGEGLRAPKLFNAEYDGNEEIKGDRLTYFRKNT